jgi:predicted kinase
MKVHELLHEIEWWRDVHGRIIDLDVCMGVPHQKHLTGSEQDVAEVVPYHEAGKLVLRVAAKGVRNLYILRGLPGSGKSTYARKRWPLMRADRFIWPAEEKRTLPVCVSIDHEFTNLSGEYVWEAKRVGQAAAAANSRIVRLLRDGVPEVIVDNTHSRLWEYHLALDLAGAFGYEVEIISLFDGGCTDEELFSRCTHNVPLDIISAQRERWEPHPDDVVVLQDHAEEPS